MKLIKIINGAYGHRPEGSTFTQAKTANDEPFVVTDAEADRLVGMQVAAYAEPVETKKRMDGEGTYAKLEEALLTHIDNADDAAFAVTSAFELLAQIATDAGVELPVTGVATPEGGGDGTGEGDNPPGDDSGLNGQEPALEKPEYNMDTSFDDLKEMLSACGGKFKVGMSRADIIAALDEYYGSDEVNDDEAPPDLSPEAPVT